MAIKFRKRRNLQRGTEIGFATIPLRDIDSPDVYKDVGEAIGKFYESQGIKRNKVCAGGREGRFSEAYNHSEDVAAMIPEVKKFVDSKEKEMSFYLLGDEYKDGFYEKHRFSLKKVGKNLLMAPKPVVHNVMNWSGKKIPFEDLMSILKGGFNSDNREGNTVYKRNKTHRFNPMYTQDETKSARELSNAKADSVNKGDVYSLEIFPENGLDHGEDADFALHKASPQRISSVNIQLDETASTEEKEQKLSKN